MGSPFTREWAAWMLACRPAHRERGRVGWSSRESLPGSGLISSAREAPCRTLLVECQQLPQCGTLAVQISPIRRGSCHVLSGMFGGCGAGVRRNRRTVGPWDRQAERCPCPGHLYGHVRRTGGTRPTPTGGQGKRRAGRWQRGSLDVIRGSSDNAAWLKQMQQAGQVIDVATRASKLHKPTTRRSFAPERADFGRDSRARGSTRGSTRP